MLWCIALSASTSGTSHRLAYTHSYSAAGFQGSNSCLEGCPSASTKTRGWVSEFRSTWLLFSSWSPSLCSRSPTHKVCLADQLWPLWYWAPPFRRTWLAKPRPVEFGCIKRSQRWFTLEPCLGFLGLFLSRSVQPSFCYVEDTHRVVCTAFSRLVLLIGLQRCRGWTLLPSKVVSFKQSRSNHQHRERIARPGRGARKATRAGVVGALKLCFLGIGPQVWVLARKVSWELRTNQALDLVLLHRHQTVPKP